MGVYLDGRIVGTNVAQVLLGCKCLALKRGGELFVP